MSNIQEQIFNAIDIITKQRIGEIKFDKTVEVVITDDENASSGEYKAQYQDLIITVYSNFNTIKYNKGDSVFILVPQGDFSKKKTIVSSGGLKGEDFVDLDNLPSGDVDIDKMGYNFVDESEDFEMTLPTNSDETITFKLKDEGMVTYYPYKKVLIVGMVLYTNINTDDLGDYGIAIEATFVNEEGDRTARVLKTKLTDIVGNPFQSRGYKEVKIELPKDERLVSVERGYSYSTGFKLGVEDNIINISELNIQYGTSKDLENVSEYSGNILSPKGTIFKSGNIFPTEKLELTMETKKQGSVIDNSEITYKWFEIDEEIKNSNQDGYHPDAGYGWRWLKEDTDGLSGFNLKTLEIQAKYVPNFSSFKCISTYKGFSINSNVVSITDNTDEMTTTVSSSNGYSFKNGIGTTVLSAEVRKNGEPQPNSDLWFKWIRISQTGEQTVLRFNEVNNIPIDIATIGGSSSFVCEVYNIEDKNTSITKGHTFLTVVFDAPNFGLSVTGGFRAVLYDEKGLAPDFNPSQFNYTLFKDGEAITENLSQKWTIPNQTMTMLTMDGSSLEADNSQSSNAKAITLGVDRSFSLGKMDNVLKLTVKHTYKDIEEVFTEYVPISITKVGSTGAEGPSGSSGPDGNTYVYEIQDGTRAISYDENGVTPTPGETEPFKLVFYKNGGDITDELERVKWELPDDSLLIFKNSTSPKKIETTSGAHTVTLLAGQSWNEKNFNNVLKVEFKYNGIIFREYATVIINKNAKDGEKGDTGAPGEGGYAVMLTNENHTFPAGKDGGLFEGSTSTSIMAFKGAGPVSFTVDDLPKSDYFELTRNNEVITIKTKSGAIPSKDSGTFDFGINIEGKKFVKTLAWSLARRGEDGTPAKYVILAGPQIFNCAPGFAAPYSPQTITITSTSYGIEKTDRKWYYRRAGENTEYLISKETQDSIVIDPGNYEMWKSATSIVLRCSVDGHSDEITIAKVASGGSPYSIQLESSNGLVFKPGDNIGTIITATLKHGDKTIDFTADLRNRIFWERIDKNGNITSTENGTFVPAYFSGLKEKIKVESTDIVEKITFNCGIKE